MTAPRARRHDPERRDRIIDACLDVIAERGVAGTSARQVATAADVPLGSVSYHFESMDELVCEALARFADEVALRVEQRMARATTREEALAAFAANIDQDVLASARDLVLTQELYTLAARRPEMREVTSAWMARTRATLTPWVDERTAVLLDAMNEGLTLHRAMHLEEPAPGLASDAIARLTGEGSAGGAGSGR